VRLACGHEYFPARGPSAQLLEISKIPSRHHDFTNIRPGRILETPRQSSKNPRAAFLKKCCPVSKSSSKT